MQRPNELHRAAPQSYPEDEYIVLKRPTPHFDHVTSDQKPVSQNQNVPVNSFRPYDQQLGYKILPFGRQRIYQQSSNSTTSGWSIFLASLSVIIGLFIGTYFGFQPQQLQTVLGTSFDGLSRQPVQSQASEYDNWVKNIISENTDKSADTDNDGLTNYQEFLLKSDPLSSDSCRLGSRDIDSLLMFINPGTCKEISWENSSEIDGVYMVLSDPSIMSVFIEKYNVEESDLALSGKFDSSPYSASDIDSYISNRTNPDGAIPPLLGEQYLQTSKTFGIKIEELLAISEYRTTFGTQSPKLKNIGLIGNNGNHTYSFLTWEGGLDSLARILYDFQTREIPQCVQYNLIFGKNGNHCERIESLKESIKAELERKTYESSDQIPNEDKLPSENNETEISQSEI